MYKIKIISNFSAAHFLRGYKGKCENLHGHNWKVEVIASRKKLDNLGMVMDFSDLKKLTLKTLNNLDHASLNDLSYFKQHNPSSEEIASYIFDNLKKVIAKNGCRLEEVRVWETDTSCACYTNSNR